jgi:hypothetical protein
VLSGKWLCRNCTVEPATQVLVLSSPESSLPKPLWTVSDVAGFLVASILPVMASLIAQPGTKQKEIAPSTIRVSLEQILGSRTFRGAEAQKKFLRYVVESVLDGRAAHIKEVSIGIDVFDRGDQFDPRIDTIVRVEARKLRTRLNRYYETEGASDPIRILFPARGYTPSFQFAEEGREPARDVAVSGPEGEERYVAKGV